MNHRLQPSSVKFANRFRRNKKRGERSKRRRDQRLTQSIRIDSGGFLLACNLQDRYLEIILGNDLRMKSRLLRHFWEASQAEVDPSVFPE